MDLSLKSGRKIEVIANGPQIILTAAYQIKPALQKAGKGSDDGMLHFSFILTTSGANSNNQYFVDDELSTPEIYLNPIYQAIDEDHLEGFRPVVGEIISSAYFPAANGKPSGIRCEGVIFEDIYPKEAIKVRRGAGKWCAVSMEALPNPLERIGKYLVIHNPTFVGAGLVRFPGNKFSQIEDIDGQGVQQTTSPQMDADPLQWKSSIVREGISILTANLRNNTTTR